MGRMRLSVSRNRWLIIAVISFLIGLIIRFYYGLTTDFWNDEAISYFNSTDLSWRELFFSNGNFSDFRHPPLYYIYLKLMLIIGHADWWLRLTSLIWFFPSIYLVYRISLFFKSRKTSYLAISLFSLHPLLINLSFQVRPYALLIFLMLLLIYAIFSNFFYPKVYKTILIGFLLSICFFISYGVIWLIFSLFFLAIFLFFKKEKMHSKNIFCSLFLFFVCSIYQICILLNYLLPIKNGNAIAGSVPYFDLNWFVYQTKLLFGHDFVGFYFPLFLVIITTNLKKDKSLINQFLFFSSTGTIGLATIISILFFPVFLARQLVLFSLLVVFVFAQFHQKLRYEFFMMITLLILAINSFNNYGFLFRENIQNTIKQKIPSNSIVLLMDDVDLISYYLLINKNNSSVYLIERDSSQNQNLQNELLSLASRDVFFIMNQAYSSDELKIKESLENNICQKHHCLDIEL